MLGSTETFEREIWDIMKKKTQDADPSINTVKKLKISSREIKMILITAVITSIVGFVVPNCFNGITGIFKMQDNIKSMETNISSLQTNVSKLSDNVSELKTNVGVANSSISSLSDRVHTIEGRTDKLFTLQATSTGSVSIEKNPVTNECQLAAPEWQSNDIIAKDTKSGTEYKAEQLVDQKLLLSYKTENSVVFFFGQFNVNNRWNDDCLINVYTNGELSLIMEANYKDGELQNYRQVIPSLENKTWIVANRTVIENYNSGDSWEYQRNSSYAENFSYENVTIDNLVNVDTFKSKLDGKLIGYYYGNTSGGCYNDDTGSAYLAKFADDGTVKTLYEGNFKDGKFNDNSGNAWYITKSENTNYMYYKGVFKNNCPTKTKGYDFKNPISNSDIKEILSGKTFNCGLNWAE